MSEQPAHSVEIEVPGTPEEVWDAIATGPGLTAWFVPAEVEGREGGTVTTYHGVSEEDASRETIDTWDPPRRYSVVYEDPTTPGATLATEFLVEARAGGTCVVRIVSRGFGDKDWESELDSHDQGWALYLRNLRSYLTHFAGQRCAPILVNGNSARPVSEAWSSFLRELGIDEAAEGARVASAPSAPSLAGVVDSALDKMLILRLEEPAPGNATVAAFEWSGRTYTSVHLYLFGPEAREIAAREEPRWRTWMDEHFPAAVRAAAAT